MKKQLGTSEWILSGSLILILSSLLIISRFHEHRKTQQLKACSCLVERSIEVSISGEVSRPGVYSTHAGARLGDLVKMSRPKRFADLHELDLDSFVENSLHISIPKLTEITVRVEGAVVTSEELTVPVGSRLCDLKSKIQLDDDADVQFFNRRRQLKDKEILTIPRTQEERGEARKIW